MNRPFVWAAIAFAGGLWAASAFGALAAALAAGGALAGLIVLKRRDTVVHTARIAAVFFLCGVIDQGLNPPLASPARLDLTPPGEWTAEVVDAPIFYPDIDFASLIVRTGNESLLLRWSDPGWTAYPGDQLRIAGGERTPISNVNFGVGSYEEYLRARGVSGAVSIRGDRVELASRPRFALWQSLARVREFEARMILRLVPEPSQPFLLAVWLGDRTRLTEDIRERFVRAGTAHVLAVSGLHVGLIFVTVETLLKMLRLRERPRTLLVIVAVFGFALLAGARVSSLRAALMVSLYVSARLFRREPDAPTALAIAALLFLAVNPALLGDTAFLLSFGAVASLMLYADPLADILASARWMPFPLARALATCAAVQMLTWPIAAHAFHVVPVGAVLMNLAAVPLLAAVLWLSLLMTAFGSLAPDIGLLFGHALHFPTQAMVGIAKFADLFSFLSLDVTQPARFALACYFAAVLLPLAAGYFRPTQSRLLRPLVPDVSSRGARWRTAGMVAVLLALSAVFWRPAPPRGVVDFLDVSHSDATVIYPPGGGVVLVDGGDSNEYVDYTKTVVLPSLHAHGVTRVDVAVATHADRDHIGGLITLMQRMPVGTLVTTSVESGKPLEELLLATAAEHDVAVVRLSAGEEFSVGGARFEALHPPLDYAPPASNDTSLVLRLTWPGANGEQLSVLLPGDLEFDGELHTIQRDCAAQVLKAGHHGSASSSSQIFLDAVRPQHAVVSTRKTGRLNAIGGAVQDRFDAAGVTIWRTDLQGGIRLEGPPLQFTTARSVRAAY